MSMEEGHGEDEDRSNRTDAAHAVFLSYARADRKVAEAIIRQLEAAGYRVWWDGLIASGDRFSPAIDTALESASAVVVLWSRASVASHWVQDEASRGRDRACLVPLSIDGTEPPLGFRQFHCVDVSGAAHRPGSPEMAQVLSAVGALLGRPPAARPPPRPAMNRRKLLIVGAGVAGVGAAAVAGWHFIGGGSDALANSLAVLPFDNLSGDPRQQYLSDGLSAELRAQLARNPLLTVMGQASSNAVRDRKKDGPAIARQLDVSYLLDGNVRVADNAVRVAVELIEGRTGFARWSESFDGPAGDVFRLQQRIAQAVDAALVTRLGGSGAESHERGGGTTNAAAYDAYLHGRSLFESQIDEASDRAALAQFERAVNLDPDYAAARAALSRALAVIANQYVQSPERKRLYRQAVTQAEKAIASAPEFPDGHAALGYAQFYGMLDMGAAGPPYEQAYRLGQGSADILSRYALYQARLKRFDKADPAIERAAVLDPLNPSMFKNNGLVRYARGDYQGAVAAGRKALGINPARATIHGDIGNALLMLGRTDEAEKEFDQEKARMLVLPGRAFIARRRDDEAGVKAAFDALVREFGDNGLYQQAQILSQWGKATQALDTLERARAEQDAGMVILLVDPFLDPLRADPRFAGLLKALHFS